MLMLPCRPPRNSLSQKQSRICRWDTYIGLETHVYACLRSSPTILFHLVLFSFRLQNILFDGPVGQEQADIPGISNASISGLETDVSRR